MGTSACHGTGLALRRQATDISKDLCLACSYLPAISLYEYEYELSMTMRKVVIEPLRL
jgi:hypothetical protein